MPPQDHAVAALERARRSESLNAFVALCDDAAADALPPGPLSGRTVAVKDFFVDGDRDPTCGSRVPASWLQGTAAVVERIRAAGGAIVGYTNMHEWGIGTTSTVTATGPIRNPHDPARMSGGSSGGSAAALAAGVVDLAIGSDAGGSIRVPSSWCGTVGLKPTFGRVPTAGFAGDGDPVDHVGPMARSVEDVAMLFGILADAPPVDLDPSSLRIGVARRHFFESADPRVAAAVDAAVAVLEDLVAEVRDVDVEGAELAGPAIGIIVPHFTAAALRADLAARPESFEPESLRVLMLGASIGEDDLARSDEVRRRLVESWHRVFDVVDVVVTPTTPSLPPPIDDPVVDLPVGPIHVELANIAVNGPMNLGGVPALSLPCGEVEGWTTNMTLTAWRDHDEVALAVGAAFEEATMRRWTGRTTSAE